MTQSAFDIVRAKAADTPAISRVAQSSFKLTFAHMPYSAEDLATFLDSAMGEARYAAQLADPAYAMALARDAAGDLVGLIKMGPNDLPMPPGEPERGQTRELHQLYLLSSAQGRGVADTLMDWGVAEARGRGARALYLSVYVGNERAQRFYARHGFVEIGKNPFRVGSVVDDDRVWRLWL